MSEHGCWDSLYDSYLAIQLIVNVFKGIQFWALFFKASCTTPESVNIYVYLYMCTGAENGHSKLSSVGGKPRTASRTAGTKRLVLSGHWAPVWWRISASRWLDSLTNTHPWLKCSLMPQMHRDDHSCTRALNPPPPPHTSISLSWKTPSRLKSLRQSFPRSGNAYQFHFDYLSFSDSFWGNLEASVWSTTNGKLHRIHAFT